MIHKTDTYSEFIPKKLALKLRDAGMGNSFGGMLSIPTYYEVFEWFCSERGIVITLEPFLAFSLKETLAYVWKLSYPNFQTGELEELKESDLKKYDMGGSFMLTANEAIEFALDLGDKRQN